MPLQKVLSEYGKRLTSSYKSSSKPFSKIEIQGYRDKSGRATGYNDSIRTSLGTSLRVSDVFREDWNKFTMGDDVFIYDIAESFSVGIEKDNKGLNNLPFLFLYDKDFIINLQFLLGFAMIEELIPSIIGKDIKITDIDAKYLYRFFGLTNSKGPFEILKRLKITNQLMMIEPQLMKNNMKFGIMKSMYLKALDKKTKMVYNRDIVTIVLNALYEDGSDYRTINAEYGGKDVIFGMCDTVIDSFMNDSTEKEVIEKFVKESFRLCFQNVVGWYLIYTASKMNVVKKYLVDHITVKPEDYYNLFEDNFSRLAMLFTGLSLFKRDGWFEQAEAGSEGKDKIEKKTKMKMPLSHDLLYFIPGEGLNMALTFVHDFSFFESFIADFKDFKKEIVDNSSYESLMNYVSQYAQMAKSGKDPSGLVKGMSNKSKIALIVKNLVEQKWRKGIMSKNMSEYIEIFIDDMTKYVQGALQKLHEGYKQGKVPEYTYDEYGKKSKMKYTKLTAYEGLTTTEEFEFLKKQIDEIKEYVNKTSKGDEFTAYINSFKNEVIGKDITLNKTSNIPYAPLLQDYIQYDNPFLVFLYAADSVVKRSGFSEKDMNSGSFFGNPVLDKTGEVGWLNTKNILHSINTISQTDDSGRLLADKDRVELNTISGIMHYIMFNIYSKCDFQIHENKVKSYNKYNTYFRRLITNCTGFLIRLYAAEITSSMDSTGSGEEGEESSMHDLIGSVQKEHINLVENKFAEEMTGNNITAIKTNIASQFKRLYNNILVNTSEALVKVKLDHILSTKKESINEYKGKYSKWYNTVLNENNWVEDDYSRETIIGFKRKYETFQMSFRDKFLKQMNISATKADLFSDYVRGFFAKDAEHLDEHSDTGIKFIESYLFDGEDWSNGYISNIPREMVGLLVRSINVLMQNVYSDMTDSLIMSSLEKQNLKLIPTALQINENACAIHFLIGFLNVAQESMGIEMNQSMLQHKYEELKNSPEMNETLKEFDDIFETIENIKTKWFTDSNLNKTLSSLKRNEEFSICLKIVHAQYSMDKFRNEMEAQIYRYISEYVYYYIISVYGAIG
jgi:hypothetical protein